MKKIIISPLFQNYMSGRIWMGLDVEQIKKVLTEKYNLEVEITPFTSLLGRLNAVPKGSVLFYATIYNPEYLQYLKDTISHISAIRPDIILLPNQDQLLSLDNKGYQEYYKKEIGIESVAGKYYGDINDLVADPQKMDYPFVLKLNEGALSSGVQLINDDSELIAFQTKVKQKTIREKVAYFLNKRNSFKKDTNLIPKENLLESNFDEFFQKRKPVVNQEFVPGLECDYKVLVFGGKYFVLKRATRKNDFRASGSGNFEWIDPPHEILSYAKMVVDKMDIPFISLDLGIDNNKKCYLFEFQGVAFGPLTLTGSDKYFEFKDDAWNKIETKSNLEDNYAYAIYKFIQVEE